MRQAGKYVKIAVMEIYFAPMEGITDYIYRRIHREYFPGVDRYFAPFLSPTQNHVFPPRELRQVLPENNRDVPLTPQLLTKNAGDFLWAAARLAEMGYKEVNLNVGCPSGTVTAKGKGSGLLAAPEALRRLLDGIFAACPVAVSVKTRLGMERPEEFAPILEIYNDYPIAQLIIHPRTKREMYGGPVHMDVFTEAAAKSRAPVCYNGDIRSPADIRAVGERFPGLAGVMIGRGLAASPGLAMAAAGGEVKKETLRLFHEKLCAAYCEAFGGPGSALHRMKAIWHYMLASFAGGEAYEKRLAKARRWDEFLALTAEIFDRCPLAQAGEKSNFQRID